MYLTTHGGTNTNTVVVQPHSSKAVHQCTCRFARRSGAYGSKSLTSSWSWPQKWLSRVASQLINLLCRSYQKLLPSHTHTTDQPLYSLRTYVTLHCLAYSLFEFLPFIVLCWCCAKQKQTKLPARHNAVQSVRACCAARNVPRYFLPLCSSGILYCTYARTTLLCNCTCCAGNFLCCQSGI